MKNLITTLFFLVMFAAAQAQGNLQFSQTKYIEWGMTLVSGPSYQFVEQSITVPPGKVWKIESAAGNFIQNSAPFPSYSSNVTILLNRKIIFYNAGSTSHLANLFPIWLPAGTYTLRLAHNSSTSSSLHEIVAGVSVIEFNITP